MEFHAIGPSEGPYAILEVILPVSSIRTALSEREDTVPVLQVVLEVSL